MHIVHVWKTPMRIRLNMNNALCAAAALGLIALLSGCQTLAPDATQVPSGQTPTLTTVPLSEPQPSRRGHPCPPGCRLVPNPATNMLKCHCP
jgi:hypothetical protein